MDRVNKVMLQLGASPVDAKAAKEAVSITSKANGVAILTIDFPPANAYNPTTHDGIEKCYKAACEDPEVKAIVITGTKSFFMAGADIGHLAGMQAKGASKDAIYAFVKKGNDLYNLIESGPKPTVAAVNGTAFGGGCELAMACNARVAVKSAKFGLPELKLGIIPGLGGTQRLPRLVGVQEAVQMTMGSKNIDATRAQKVGLVDAVVPSPKELLAAAVKAALAIAGGSQPRRKSLYFAGKLGDPIDARLIIEGARQQAKKKGPAVPHPFLYLDAVLAGVNDGGDKGLEKEMQCMTELVMSPSAKALIHFFLAEKATAKVPGISAKDAKPLKTVAVIGAGTMGAGIVIVFLMAGYKVILKEYNQAFLEAGVERIIENINRVIKARKMPTMALEFMMRGLVPQTTYDGFDTADVVIEAAVEDIKVKQEIFQKLEEICKPTCILATNTSTIDIELVGKNTKAMDRLIGLHFFSPAHVMPLLEIIRTEKTSPVSIATSMAMSKQIKKTGVLVGNCVGFTANRIFFPYGQSASLLVDSGIEPYRIDKALEKWGMPMGVFRMSDLSGVDIFLHVSKIIASAYGSRCYLTTMGQKLMEAKRLGQKTGKGYYMYKAGKPVPDAAAIAPLLAASRADAKASGNAIALPTLSDEDIVEMTIFPVMNESYRVLDEKHVLRASDIDVVSVMGYGFPAYRGGIMHYASACGLKHVAARLQYFSETYGKNSPVVKAFFAPCARLVADAGKA